MSSKSRQLIVGSLLRICEYAVNVIAALILTPVIIQAVGDRLYGVWIFVGSFLGYYGLFELGLDSAVKRFIARAIGAKDFLEINRVFNTSLLIFSCIGLFILFLTLVLSLFLPFIVPNVSDHESLFRILILLVGLNYAISLPLKIFSGFLTANMRFDVNTLVELSKTILRSALIFLFLKHGFGILSLAVIILVTDSVSNLVKFVFIKKFYKELSFSFNFFDKNKVKGLFSYSFISFINQIAEQLRFNVDNLVIVTILGFSQLTTYSIGARLVKYFKDFVLSATGMSMPLFSQYDGLKDYERIKEKYLFLTKINVYIGITFSAILLIFAKPFIRLWVGQQYSFAYIILILLLIPSFFEVVHYPGNGLLFGTSRHRFCAFLNISEGVLNLILSFYFARRFGIAGVALGTAVPMVITKLFIQPIYMSHLVGISVRSLYSIILNKEFFLVVIITFSYYFLTSKLDIQSFFMIFLLSFFLGSILLLVLFILGFDNKEKKVVREAILITRSQLFKFAT